MFVDPTTGLPMGYTAASDQPMSTGVPSMVATWATAVRDYGRLSLGADLQPAIHIAKRGFAVNFDFNQLEQSGLSTLQAYPASRSLLLTSSGDPLPIGTWLRNPDLAHTYELIARRGPSALYDGPIGQAIVQADDHPVLTPGQTIVTAPGIITMNDLQVLSHTDPRADPSDLPGTEDLRDGAAVERRLDRGRDPQHPRRLSARFRVARHGPVSVPRGVPARLRRPQRLRRRPRIRPCAPRRPAGSGVRGDAPLPDRQHRGHLAGRGRLAVRPVPGLQRSAASSQASSASPEAHHTNNIVTEDKWGDIVAYTNTINFFGGSGQVVPGYGFLLNNELTDFDFAPPSPGAYDPNLPAPGKEPRSSMGPVIALRDGQPQFAIGAAGGSTIITTVVQILINHVDFGMSLPAALAAPRVSQTNSSSNSSLAEPDFYNSALAQQLTSQYGEHFSPRHRVDPPARQLPGGCDRAAAARARPGRGDRRAGPPRRRKRPRGPTNSLAG